MSLRRIVLIGALAAVAAAPGTALADGQLLTGGQIPRVEPFIARTVTCADASCLDITWRTRGRIGPALTWSLTVIRPDGRAVYRGSGRSRVGERVAGTLVPSARPLCGAYSVRLRVADRTEAHLEDERTVVRRHRCVRPKAGR